MDIEWIRAMVEAGNYRTTYEFDARMSQREFTLEEVKEAIRTGRIVREEPKVRGGAKCTVRGWTPRTIAGLRLSDLFPLEIAVGLGGDVVVFITAYWVE
jgi:hypothetical protein